MTMFRLKIILNLHYEHEFQDIMRPLATLSLVLQKSNITLADAKDTIFSTVEVLEQFEAK